MHIHIHIIYTNMYIYTLYITLYIIYSRYDTYFSVYDCARFTHAYTSRNNGAFVSRGNNRISRVSTRVYLEFTYIIDDI